MTPHRCGPRSRSFALLAPLALAAQLANPLAAPLAAQTRASAPAGAAVRARLDSLVRAYVDSAEAPGVSVLVLRGRDTLLNRGVGRVDLENDVTATPRSVYRIGSITKQFTAAAVMQFAESGRLALDDSIAAHLPGLPAPWRPVTIRQLLNHTSGIPSYTDIGLRWVRRWREDMPTDTILALTATDSMWFAPGTKWRYDNTGYVLLGALIERLSGQPYHVYLQEKLFTPLGLADTRYCDDVTLVPRRAHGYDRVAGAWRNARFLSMTQPHAAGALCSTVGDLARWNALLATGRVVSAASYQQMTTPTGAAVASKYGFGLAVDTLGGRRMIEHGGGIHGFVTANMYFPAESLSVTVLTNAGSGNPGRLATNLARVALGVPLPQMPRRVTLTAEERARYVGRYTLALPNGNQLGMAISVQGDKLMSQATGQGAFELFPYGNHVFGVPFDPAVRLTFVVEGARATKLTLLQGGQTIEGRRVGDQ